MDHVPRAAPIRVARPSSDLGAIETFWTGGVGLDLLWRSDNQDQHPDEHDLLMVGPRGGGWHLELVGDPVAARESSPGAEDLLVLYLGERPDPAWLDSVREAGGTVVPARNPYWDAWGVTVRDPDGYLLVLSHRTWE